MIRLFFFLTLLLSIACRRNDAGFSVLENGVKYKIITLGDGDIQVEKAHDVVWNISIADTLNTWSYSLTTSKLDSVFKDEKTLVKSRQLVEGDSVSFLGNIALFRLNSYLLKQIEFTNHWTVISINIKPTKVVTKEEFDASYANFLLNKEMMERESLLNYLEVNEILDSCIQMGQLYYQYLHKKKEGKTPLNNDIVSLHYRGMTLEGKPFISTRKSGVVHEFPLGKPGQVVQGVLEIVKIMKSGESVRVFLPSQLAFGDNGSFGEIVKPYTTVVFDVELLSVEKAKN